MFTSIPCTYLIGTFVTNCTGATYNSISGFHRVDCDTIWIFAFYLLTFYNIPTFATIHHVRVRYLRRVQIAPYCLHFRNGLLIKYVGVLNLFVLNLLRRVVKWNLYFVNDFAGLGIFILRYNFETVFIFFHCQHTILNSFISKKCLK